MDAAIIAIGSELLTPEKIDTNSLYLTERLNARGVEVVLKMVVGDNRQRLVAAMRHALAAADLLILSGGLGPTEDDVTRDAVADLCGRALIFDPGVLEAIEERFRRLNRPMAEINRRQAYVIPGAHILPNSRGTAPGQWVEHNRQHILLLPGPPVELKTMFEAHCLPRLDALLPAQVIRTRQYRVAGMAESDLDQLISPIYSKYKNPATTILAAPGDIQIHLRARCATEAEAEALLAEVGDPIAELLGNRIYSRNGDPLEKVVGDLLKQRSWTLAVAESCTGGMLGERITSVPGSSNYFAGGFLTYSYEAKTKLLGIDSALLEEHKAVSAPVAQAMAEAARQLLGTHFGVSITGVAGPDPGPETEPPGVFYVGLASASSCQAKRFQWAPGDRHRIRVIATQSALDLLRRALIS
ncbi:MAG: competence/damage-inducible protein A [Bryobacteraceae bacterium]|nr:competence/damage-inducible protein A [Bryobacteraceae bacterium]MDW8379499.1 competence/damage-inducible protein A [Bryobacterales bacterium]